MNSIVNEPEGILLIDKPSGCTSHDVVDCIRRKLKMRQIGHAGTLDPIATGLLILLIGKATKVSQYLVTLDKIYEGTLKLGQTTDSHDSEGECIEQKEIPDLSKEKILETMKSFLGNQQQIPPMFSAKKVNGTPLYKLARKGQQIERESHAIHIASFDLTAMDLPQISFSVACSKGTYVRTIAHDFGQKLGCGAHLIQLRRVASGHFHISKALTLDQLETISISEIKRQLIPIYQAVPSSI
ncbi:MAG: tRNA pseudouridine(55) synthase TruB [Verrucomicrobia bacterium GWC2_42_7]|nr:MAG: tRNA pseudouridine(55) synthase TruB [Verrucomicrobia bacterium GWC2_42_7]